MTLALGGRVVQLGRGQGCLNVLDPGAAMAAAERLTGEARRKLMADSLGRRLTMVSALVALNRRAVVTDVEEALVAAASSVLDDKYRPGRATLVELVGVLEAGPEPVRRLTLDRGDDERYRAAVHGLQSSIAALLQGAMGDSFAHRTTTPMVLDGPLDVDISGIGGVRREAAGRRHAGLLGRGLRGASPPPKRWLTPASNASGSSSSSSTSCGGCCGRGPGWSTGSTP